MFLSRRKNRQMLSVFAFLLTLCIALPGGSAFAQNESGDTAAPAAASAEKKPAAPLEAMTGINASIEGKIITVTGRLSNAISDADGSGRWYLTDGKGVAVLDVASDSERLASTTPRGTIVTATGTVKSTNSGPHVVVTDTATIQAEPKDTPLGYRAAEAEEGAKKGKKSSTSSKSATSSSTSAAKRAAAKEAAAAAMADATLPAGAVGPGELTKALVGKTVTVGGRITQFRGSKSENAPNTVYIEFKDKKTSVVFWPDVGEQIGDRKAEVTKAGKWILATGTVTEYNGKLQVKVNAPADLRALDLSAPAAAIPAPADAAEAATGTVPATTAASAPAADAAAAPAAPSAAAPAAAPASTAILTPSQVTKAMVDQVVTVRGNVKTVNASTKDNVPHRITLTDEGGKGSLTVVYWSDKASEFSGDNAPKKGKAWAIVGTVGEYNGKLQLRAERAAK